LSQDRSPIHTYGAILEVTYNWFTFSEDAINIYGGNIEWRYGQYHDICVPKGAFPDRPEIVWGISGFTFQGRQDDEDMYKRPNREYFRVEILLEYEENEKKKNVAMKSGDQNSKDDETEDEDTDDENSAEDWIFTFRAFADLEDGPKWVHISWVAVSKGNGYLMRPSSEQRWSGRYS
jgi:hypothetical protein